MTQAVASRLRSGSGRSGPVAREVKTSGRTVYLPDREEWEETPTLWRCPSCGVKTTSRERAEKLGHSRPSHKIGLCFTKMEPVKPEAEICWAQTSEAILPPLMKKPGPPTETLAPDRVWFEAWGPKPTEPAPSAGPWPIGPFEVSGFVEHEPRCSGCGEPWKAGQLRERYHYVPAPGGWRKCGEWR